MNIIEFHFNLQNKVPFHSMETKNDKIINFNHDFQFDDYEDVTEEDESLRLNIFYPSCALEGKKTLDFVVVTNNMVAEETFEQMEPATIKKPITYNLSLLEKYRKNDVVSLWLSRYKMAKRSM